MLDNNKRRIHGFEVEAVREAVREKLAKLVEDEEDLSTAQTLGRVLYSARALTKHELRRCVIMS